MPPAQTAAEARDQLGDDVAVYLEDGPVADRASPSTIVDVTGERPRILRAGAVARGRAARGRPGHRGRRGDTRPAARTGSRPSSRDVPIAYHPGWSTCSSRCVGRGGHATCSPRSPGGSRSWRGGGAAARPRRACGRDAAAWAASRCSPGFALALFVAGRLPTLRSSFSQRPGHAVGPRRGRADLRCSASLDDRYELDSLTKLAGQVARDRRHGHARRRAARRHLPALGQRHGQPRAATWRSR